MKAASIRCSGNITVDQTVDGAHGEVASLRPDIVARDEEKTNIKIIDVAIPFQSRWEAFQSVRQEKVQKYWLLAEQLEDQGYTVDLDAFIVGSLGGWDHNNERVISSLKNSHYYAVLMRKLMTTDKIRWSRDIYVQHLSGIWQYQD